MSDVREDSLMQLQRRTNNNNTKLRYGEIKMCLRNSLKSAVCFRGLNRIRRDEQGTPR